MEQNIKVEELNADSSGVGISGIWQVFLSPSNFFTRLKNNPNYLVPILVIIVTSLILMFSISDYIVKMQLESPQLQERLQGQPLPEQAKTIMKFTTIGVGVIGMTLTPFLSALVALLFASMVMSSKVKYSEILSVTLYGAMLFSIGQLIYVPLIIAKGSMAVSLSLGALVMDQGLQSLSFIALSKIGLFNIWEIIVVGIGLAIFYGESRNKGYILSVLSLGLLSVLHVALSAIMI